MPKNPLFLISDTSFHIAEIAHGKYKCNKVLKHCLPYIQEQRSLKSEFTQ